MIAISLGLLLLLLLDLSSTATSFATKYKKNSDVRLFLANDEPTASENFVFTDRLVSKSGLPVCKYALGGAARSTQPTELVHEYCEIVRNWFETSGDATTRMAPFLFFYNPHRYPYFMMGVQEIAQGDSEIAREDLFLASGGTDFSKEGMEQRLSDALAYSGGDYLDMFVLEYVCPDEIEYDPQSILDALSQARSWVESGKVRYVAASTHSHKVGAWLGSLVSETDDEPESNSNTPLLDAIMLRYNMAHRSAAERISFPVCSEAGIPVMAFTTTRWNRLQDGHPSWKTDDDANPKRLPTTPDCLSFALSPLSSKLPDPWPVQVALHSARTVDELEEAMLCLSRNSPMTESQDSQWREYGDLEWNDIDGFDEYPEEQCE